MACIDYSICDHYESIHAGGMFVAYTYCSRAKYSRKEAGLVSDATSNGVIKSNGALVFRIRSDYSIYF